MKRVQLGAMRSSIIATTALFALTNAVAFSGPEQTSMDPNAAAQFQGWTPRPTELPKAHLDIRDGSSQAVLGYESPDETCGFIDGLAGEYADLCARNATV